MRLLLFSLASGLSLGSASPPPPPMLSYDVAGVRDWDSDCLVSALADCAYLAGSEGRIALATPDEAIELVMEDAAVSIPAPLPAAPNPQSTDAQPPASAPPAAARPADDGLRVVISIPEQKAYVFEEGELVATSPVSTGKRGHETPAGTFRILQKKVRHFSNLYDNAPMPYMQRLTHGGIALHAGQLPGYPASHGCIRLPWSFAKKLYGMTTFATRVIVTRDSLETPEEALNLL